MSLFINDVSKSFGLRVALSGITLAVSPGEVVALLGPNGAGKTTLLRIAALLSRPNSGEVRVAGLDASREPQQARRHIGYVSHRTMLYDDLTGRQNLMFYARLYDVAYAADRVRDLLDWTGLEERADELVRGYSRGMQQRLTIARALVHRPDVLLLDEPTTGLDSESATRVESLLRHMTAEGCAVVMSTHDLDRVSEMAHRMTVLVDGRLCADTRLDGWSGAEVAERYRTWTTDGVFFDEEWE
jgi:heme ABC exporter ATP-binding subunit CcmA